MTTTEVERFEVAIIGAGFGGLATAYELAGSGIDDVVIFERSDGVGGTWRQNRYPGAACDVPSHLYSLSFAPNPDWSRTYATQPEILRYIEDCYDRFGPPPTGALRHRDRLDRLGRRPTPLVPVRPGRGRTRPGSWSRPSACSTRRPCPTCPASTHSRGPPSTRPAGTTTTTSPACGWPSSVPGPAPSRSFRPSSSGPGRSTSTSGPRPGSCPARTSPTPTRSGAAFADRPEVARRLRDEQHDTFEHATTFFTGDPTGAAIEVFARDYLARKVPDPGLRARLTPDYPIGCKRTLVSSNFYSALQRDDVELVTAGIERIEPGGIRTVDGTERPCDTIVLCTGFHAAEYLRGIEVTGRDGADLHRRWPGSPAPTTAWPSPGSRTSSCSTGPIPTRAATRSFSSSRPRPGSSPRRSEPCRSRGHRRRGPHRGHGA